MIIKLAASFRLPRALLAQEAAIVIQLALSSQAPPFSAHFGEQSSLEAARNVGDAQEKKRTGWCLHEFRLA